MENLKVKLESGAEIEVWLASFQEGHALWMAISKELKDTDFSEVTVGRMSLDVLSSDSIMKAVWPCLGKALYTGNGYDKKKCTPDIFEKAEVRNDFLQIVEEVAFFNINPFSRKIGSLLKTIFLRGITDTQKSK